MCWLREMLGAIKQSPYSSDKGRPIAPQPLPDMISIHVIFASQMSPKAVEHQKRHATQRVAYPPSPTFVFSFRQHYRFTRKDNEARMCKHKIWAHLGHPFHTPIIGCNRDARLCAPDACNACKWATFNQANLGNKHLYLF